jgi:hypothetical protein
MLYWPQFGRGSALRVPARSGVVCATCLMNARLDSDRLAFANELDGSVYENTYSHCTGTRTPEVEWVATSTGSRIVSTLGLSRVFDISIVQSSVSAAEK